MIIFYNSANVCWEFTEQFQNSLNNDQLKILQEWQDSLPISPRNKLWLSAGIFALISLVIMIINGAICCKFLHRNNKYPEQTNFGTQLYQNEIEYNNEFFELKEKTEKEQEEIYRRYSSSNGEFCGIIEFKQVPHNIDDYKDNNQHKPKSLNDLKYIYKNHYAPLHNKFTIKEKIITPKMQ